MDARWTAHLDAHIAGGRIATEAESAEVLSWLLKLEPEQRWCLLLSRAPCLERLVDSDYRRILKLMVELEPASLTGAPLPPAPCFDPAVEPEPEQLELAAPLPAVTLPDDGRLMTIRPLSRRARLAVLSSIGLTMAALVVGAVWLLGWHGGPRIESVARETESLREKVETQRRDGASMLAFLALGNLSRQAATGQPFGAELSAFESLWGESDETAFLAEPAREGVPEPGILIKELADLNESFNTRYHNRAPQARYSPEPYRAPGERQQLDLLWQNAVAALARARQGDWTGAINRLQAAQDAGYQDWLKRARQWAAVHQRLQELQQRIWSQLTVDMPAQQPPAPNAPSESGGR